jgi:hypothetical protein
VTAELFAPLSKSAISSTYAQIMQDNRGLSAPGRRAIWHSSDGHMMMKTLVRAAATTLALSAAPVFGDAAHFQPAGAQPTSAAGAYVVARVLEPGTRGDVVDT